MSVLASFLDGLSDGLARQRALRGFSQFCDGVELLRAYDPSVVPPEVTAFADHLPRVRSQNVRCTYCRRPRRDAMRSCEGCGAVEVLS